MTTVEQSSAAILIALRDAARQWLAEHGDPFNDGDYYSTGNGFLIEAEHAFWEAHQAWRATHAQPAREGQAPTDGFWLYRLWGEGDRLLYVGVSTNLRGRLRAHRRRWGDLIKNVTWEAHESAEAMLVAERQAIQDEDPAFNVAGLGKGSDGAHS